MKPYNVGQYIALGLNFEILEVYYSTSQKNVIRGMHLQLPPYDHTKVVFCSKGSVLDVLVDLRKKEPTYGLVSSVELSGANALQVFVPRGVAHGFLSIEDGSILTYLTSSVHIPSHDSGIRWDSFGFNWGVSQEIVSDRDKSLERFKEFESPF